MATITLLADGPLVTKMDGAIKDLKYALRVLTRNPGFVAIAIITLASGIGVNAAIFSIVNAYLFRPLPAKDSGQLVVVATKKVNFELPYDVSYPNYQDIRNCPAFSDAIASTGNPVNVIVDGRPERTRVDLVSGNYFTMLGINPAMGRTFTEEEGRVPGAADVIVLGFSYWQSRLGGDPSAIGKTIKVNGVPFTIIGVAPKGFNGTEPLLSYDAFLPAGVMGQLYTGGDQTFVNRNDTEFRVMARLRPGMVLDEARSALGVLASQLEQQNPASNTGIGFVAQSEIKSRPTIEISDQFRQASFVFLGLVGLVLVISCVNVANLMLVRASARRKELAVRGALGASRLRLTRLFLIESVLLAGGGALGGIVLASWSSDLLSNIRVAADAPVRFDFSLDWRVVGFTILAASAAAMLSGLLPAVRASRVDLNEALKEGGRGMIGSRGGHRLRNMLVAGQVAVSLLLLVCSGLFIRSLERAETSDPGFRTKDLVMASVDLSLQRYDKERGKQFYRQLVEKARSLPSVRTATTAYIVPFGGHNEAENIITEDNPVESEREREMAFYNSVGSDYFETMGTAILEGRDFSEQDDESALPVAIVSQAMALKFWPGQDPLGKRFKLSPDRPYLQVVGVSRDEKHIFIGEDPRPFFYLPAEQAYRSEATLELYTEGGQESLAAAVRQIVGDIDPDMPVFGVRTMTEHLNNGLAFFFIRIGAALAGIFGALALLLAAIGIYGVISYSAGQRSHEIGLRMAMGATRVDVLRLVLKNGSIVVGLGMAIGAAAAVAATRLLSGLLYDVSPQDPIAYFAVIAVLAAVALTACYIPAMRAARVDPMAALRCE
jgi:predicted permease